MQTQPQPEKAQETQPTLENRGYLIAIVGIGLVIEYVALGLAYDFQPIRNFATLGEVGYLLNQGVTVGIVAIASLGLFLAAKRGCVRFGLIGSQLRAARGRLALHFTCLLALVLVSHGWFRIGGPPSVPTGVAVLWVSMALATGGSALAVAYDPRLPVALDKVVLASVGALCIGVLALAIADSANVLWAPLQEATLHVVAALSAVFYPDLTIDTATAIIGTPHFAVSVEPMCSGVEGMGLMALLMPTFIWFHRRAFRLPRAFWLVPLGVAGAWLINSVRIFLLVVLGVEVSPALATGAFHSRAGWLMFSMLAIGLAAYAIRSPVWSVRDAPPPSDATADRHGDLENPVAPYVLPLVTLIGTAMVTGTFVLDVDHLYGLRGLLVLAVAWRYRGIYRTLAIGWNPTFAIGGGLLAFGVWWLLTEPAWLPGWVSLSGQEGRIESRARAGELAAHVGPAWIAVRTIVSSTIVPFAEELAFRGYLLRRLARREFETLSFNHVSVFAILASSLAFGVLHDNWLAGFAAGLIYALVQIKTGSLANAIVAHAITNAAVAVQVLTFGAWHQWL